MVSEPESSSLFKEPNRELEIIFQSLPDLLIRLKPDGTIIQCYGTIDDTLPFTVNDLRGNRFDQFVPPELAAQLHRDIQKIKSGVDYTELEFTLPSSRGLRWYESRNIPLAGTDEITVLIRDITDQKLIELELRANEERYRLISTVTSDYMFSTTLDKNGDLMLNWVAGAFEKITGFTLEEYIASGGWVSRVHPDDREIDRRDMERLKQNLPVVSDIRTFTKSGSVAWVRSYAHPVWDSAQNKLMGIYGAVQEITAVKQAEQALIESEARYRYLFEQNPAPMLIYDRENLKIRAVNSAFERNYGYSADEALQMILTDLYPENEVELIFQLVPRLIGYQNVGEWHHIKKDGSVMAIVACSHDIQYDDRPCRVAVITDVTERQLAEDRIKRLNTELEKRVQERTSRLQMINSELEAFSYSVSHDLRAPLRGVSGYTHFLREDFGHLLPPEGIELLDLVDTNVMWMEHLIQGMLQLSRVGRHPLDREEISPKEIVMEAWENLQTERKDSTCQLVVDPLPVCQADPLLLKQVFINLLSNGVKYSRQVPDPIIRVGSSVKDGRVVYWVKDNGAGFDMMHARDIFEAFHRVPDMEKVEGHGVGLSIVQRIINRHGGEIWAESQPGRGATFFFTLPNG